MPDGITIRRVPRPAANYTTIDNSVIDDETLSDAALGRLVRLLRKPDNWIVRMSEMTAGKTKPSVVKASVKELVDAGYMRRTYVRGQKGKIAGSTYEVSESKAWCDSDRHAEKPRVGESQCILSNTNTIHLSSNKLDERVAHPADVTTNPPLGVSNDDKQEASEPQATTEPVQSSLLPITPVTTKKPRPKKPTTPKPFWPIVEAVTTALFGLDAPSGRVFSFVLGETRQRIKMGFIEAYTGHKPEDITIDAANDIAELIRDAAKFTRNEDHLSPPLTPEGLGALILRYKDSQTYRVKQDRKAWDAMYKTPEEVIFA